MLAVLFLLLAIALATFLYTKNAQIFSYWRRRGFPYETPSVLWGNLGDVMARRVSFGVHMYELYKKTTAPLVQGIFFFYRPALLVTDAALATQILEQDFASFHDRGNFYNPKTDPISSHLFNMPGTA